MKAIAVIPARLASTRLPRKMLRDIAGQPLVGRVYNAVRSCSLLADVIVATDSDEIMAVCQRNGWKAQMTSSSHRSGTEHVHEISVESVATITSANKEQERTALYTRPTSGCPAMSRNIFLGNRVEARRRG